MYIMVPSIFQKIKDVPACKLFSFCHDGLGSSSLYCNGCCMMDPVKISTVVVTQYMYVHVYELCTSIADTSI